MLRKHNRRVFSFTKLSARAMTTNAMIQLHQKDAVGGSLCEGLEM
jgi:hypothetical protein